MIRIRILILIIQVQFIHITFNFTSMGCCCVKVLNYCDVSACGDIDMGIEAQFDGLHKLVLAFLGTQITLEKEFLSGEQIIFPVTDLNESFSYTARLYDPEGTQILILKDGITYDCFEFSTVMAVAV